MSLTWAASSSASAAPIMKLSSVARWHWGFLTVCAKLPWGHKYLIKTGHLSTNNDPRDRWGWRKEESSTLPHAPLLQCPTSQEWTLGWGGGEPLRRQDGLKRGGEQKDIFRLMKPKHYLLIGTTCLQINSIHVAHSARMGCMDAELQTLSSKTNSPPSSNINKPRH